MRKEKHVSHFISSLSAWATYWFSDLYDCFLPVTIALLPTGIIMLFVGIFH